MGVLKGLQRWVLVGGGCVCLAAGCHHEICGHLPPLTGPLDAQTTRVIGPAVPPAPAPSDQEKQDSKREPFKLPSGLPGSEAQPIQLPRLSNLKPDERNKLINEKYPPLPPVPPDFRPALPPSGQPLTLADLQALATEKSPLLKRAAADIDAAYGAMVQSGLHPNPLVGYEADQVQPGNNAGQQGGFIQQLIKTAGKLKLAQAVSSMDYLNAKVSFRRAQVDLATQVRAYYFAVLVAQESIAVNRRLVELTDEVYRLQLKLVTGGEAAGYEPLQLFALAVQARNSLIQAENRYRAAWRQLAAALGDPCVPCQVVAGTADVPAPYFDCDKSKDRLLTEHTDVLTARNTILQAEFSLRLAEVTPIPDVQANGALQHDYATRFTQYNIQIGVPIPIWDQNQGAIHQARAQLQRAHEDLRVRQNELLGRLGEVFARYDSNRQLVANYRDSVLPNLARAYRAIYQRYQQEPDKVGFNDVVVAQQNYAQALASFLVVLADQWTAVVDLANLLQVDELYCPPPGPAQPEGIPLPKTDGRLP